MIEVLQYEFIRNALTAGFLISLACGIIGTLIVVNRMVFLSGGIAHAAYGGIGIAFFTGIPPLLGASLFSVCAALLMGILTLKHKHRADAIIGAIWAIGMALGIILIDLTPGYNIDLMSYLFGSILTVPTSYLWLMCALNIIILAVVMVFYKEFIAMSYDEEFASLRGVPVTILYFVLLALAALTIVMTIQAVGLILVIALLTIPTYIAERYSGSLGHMMVFSFINGSIFVLLGLWFSYKFNLTSGAAIIMVATVFFFIFLISGKVRERLKRRMSESAE